jgi:chromosome partitioning protein
MGKTIFVGARKGGVGKTMTAASLGFGLAKQGKRVLLLDCDSQYSLNAVNLTIYS